MCGRPDQILTFARRLGNQDLTSWQTSSCPSRNDHIITVVKHTCELWTATVARRSPNEAEEQDALVRALAYATPSGASSSMNCTISFPTPTLHHSARWRVSEECRRAQALATHRSSVALAAPHQNLSRDQGGQAPQPRHQRPRPRPIRKIKRSRRTLGSASKPKGKARCNRHRVLRWNSVVTRGGD